MLVIDIGNSRIKWHNAGEPMDQFSSETYTPGQLADRLFDWFESVIIEPPVVICSVAAAKDNDAVRGYFESRHLEVRFIEVSEECAGVRNAYQQQQNLGVDRWVAMVSAYNKYKTAVCVVDAGTAVTIDMVDGRGQHLGGLITPGLRLMRQSLLKGTAGINRVSTGSPLLAQNTADAVNTGSEQLLVSGIGGIIDGICKAQGKETMIVVTGGDGQWLAESLATEVKLEPGLILEGLERFF